MPRHQPLDPSPFAEDRLTYGEGHPRRSSIWPLTYGDPDPRLTPSCCASCIEGLRRVNDFAVSKPKHTKARGRTSPSSMSRAFGPLTRNALLYSLLLAASASAVVIDKSPLLAHITSQGGGASVVQGVVGHSPGERQRRLRSSAVGAGNAKGHTKRYAVTYPESHTEGHAKSGAP